MNMKGDHDISSILVTIILAIFLLSVLFGILKLLPNQCSVSQEDYNNCIGERDQLQDENKNLTQLKEITIEKDKIINESKEKIRDYETAYNLSNLDIIFFNKIKINVYKSYIILIGLFLFINISLSLLKIETKIELYFNVKKKTAKILTLLFIPLILLFLLIVVFYIYIAFK